MLEVFFCNVGDGDAVLIRELREEGTDYAVLVDAGRPYVESREGSLRKENQLFMVCLNPPTTTTSSHPIIPKIKVGDSVIFVLPGISIKLYCT